VVLTSPRELVELGLEGPDLPVLSVSQGNISTREPPLHILLKAMETPTRLAVHALSSETATSVDKVSICCALLQGMP
jgi:hypothetical protein